VASENGNRSWKGVNGPEEKVDRQQENGFMRHNQNRRSRGRNNNRKGPNPLSRSFESNGPDVKIRGTAVHVADKYMTLARDAHAAGDPVSAENYLQHAEHYNRIVMAAQAQFQQSQPQFREGGPDEPHDEDRQMNGRPRDRFDFNGDDRQGDGDGENRFETGEGGDDDRGFRPPMQSRSPDQDLRPRGPRPDRFEHRGDRQDYRGDRQDRGGQDRGGQDRGERRDRNDYREGGQRAERFQRQDEPAQPEMPAPVEAVVAPPPSVSDEAPSQPRRRRGRPRGEEAAADGETPDGAAALAAFPDR
jgi:hypothetical protein